MCVLLSLSTVVLKSKQTLSSIIWRLCLWQTFRRLEFQHFLVLSGSDDDDQRSPRESGCGGAVRGDFRPRSKLPHYQRHACWALYMSRALRLVWRVYHGTCLQTLGARWQEKRVAKYFLSCLFGINKDCILSLFFDVQNVLLRSLTPFPSRVLATYRGRLGIF